ncbi:hypothetical protein [Myxococcus landrumensis]|uniref:Lipoprotein n=1 Tax=Myxococcus landrumensis TaxID=2813577 RepID=A0ABX7N3Q6_9BACT|nr:hypothetical protein [Myxococcus landrumus]QSQ13355.1 hypothetical protein JY572_34250 [Myxococcus landrumus]
MSRALTSLSVAAILALGMVACGIKGAPKPPLAAPVPATETPPPPSDTEQTSVETVGPSLMATTDAGILTPTPIEDAGSP